MTRPHEKDKRFAFFSLLFQCFINSFAPTHKTKIAKTNILQFYFYFIVAEIKKSLSENQKQILGSSIFFFLNDFINHCFFEYISFLNIERKSSKINMSS